MIEEDDDVVLVVVPLSYVVLLESIANFDPDWASSEDWEAIDDVRSIVIEDTEVLTTVGMLNESWAPDMDSDQPRDYTMLPNPRPEIGRYSLSQLGGEPDAE